MQQPTKRRQFSFFDVDDTLISVKSMLSFQDYWYHMYPDAEKEASYRKDLLEHMHPGACWAHLNRLYYQHFSGRAIEHIASVSRQWYETMQHKSTHFYHQNVVERLQQHQALGHTPVFVSGSFRQLLEPIAHELKVNHILAIDLKVKNGQCTGDIMSPQTIGEGKAIAITQFLQKHNTNPKDCFAYGDDISDLPMLQLIGTAGVVAGGRGLEAEASKNGWEIIQP
ncbi:HAD family hydrolase [Gilvimarinus sp. 1_MG-2023]|uniref:HAD family hydrolase n=1 Tax=Gilvimarinus sp. 1_MG-2023 TaxID=3062638 RepID=UPI0026E22AD3|nr:HAD-IB family hydrolase [Gilvimarinus sp. 1_MG-2023]MDO6748391.1 HAD-IB family hydrolase [Gilvimarinus sp. 1_MG-2023]